MIRVKAFTLLAGAVLFAPAAALAAHWTSAVVLVPLDKGAYASAARISEYLEQAVGASASYRIGEQTQKVFGIATPPDAKESQAAGRGEYLEGKRLFSQSYLEEAESKFKKAVKTLEQAVPVLEGCNEYCDALAYLGATLQMKSNDEQARDYAKSVLILDPKYHFEGRGFGQNYMVIAKDVQKSLLHEAQFSTASVYSTPPGGKVFVDGKEKGYTPLSIDQIYAGKHLVRIERQGSFIWGQVITVAATEDAVIKAKLQSTPEHAAIDDMLDRVVAEVEKGAPGPDSIALCGKLKVDRAVIGVVRSQADSVTLEAGLIDAKGKKRLSARKARFEGDEYGQLEREVEKFASGLLNDAERGGAKNTSRDPLDHVDGTETWGDEPVKTEDRKRNRGGEEEKE